MYLFNLLIMRWQHCRATLKEIPSPTNKNKCVLSGWVPPLSLVFNKEWPPPQDLQHPVDRRWDYCAVVARCKLDANPCYTSGVILCMDKAFCTTAVFPSRRALAKPLREQLNCLWGSLWPSDVWTQCGSEDPALLTCYSCGWKYALLPLKKCDQSGLW